MTAIRHLPSELMSTPIIHSGFEKDVIIPHGLAKPYLHFGCGKKPLKDFVNADIMNLGNNIVFDFDSFPYPFKDNHFGYVYSRMVFEHLKNPYAVLEELWRIMRKGAFIDIIVPHYTSPGAHNPLHLCFYDSHVMDFVDKNMIRHAGLNDYGFTCDFELISTRLNFSKGKQFWNYAVELIANKKPDLYEGTPLSAFPCSSITFRMKARK